MRCTTIRVLILAAGILTGTLTSPADARGCWGGTNGWYCDQGCRITDRWWDHSGREWIRYHCSPQPSSYASPGSYGPDPTPAFVIGGILLIIIVVILAAVESASSTPASPFENERTRIADEMALTEEQITKLEAAGAEADRHIAAFLKDGGTLDGDPHG